MKARILLVEDDEYIGAVTKKRLEEAGYDVVHSIDGQAAWEQFQLRTFDICLLDVVMPKKDGLTLAQQIRTVNDHIPILFLTSKNEKEDRIAGLRTGADDYISKPFSMQELILRIEVFLKRTRSQIAKRSTTFAIGKLMFDYEDLRLYNETGEISISLTQKEAELLRYLCENPNKTLKREDILSHVWGKDDYFLGRSMDVFVTKLRKHFKSDPHVKLETLHGVGFRFNIPVKS
ncbi:response regulator transcription factor [Chitinophaga varians]|nr:MULTISPECIES: response regulator transcription factor [Chitinophaga]MBC9910428.1 response regulator transcription factor [Chitinophaga varians]MBC9933961.1 response regulator transcription factor [Chitinophaga qingshengii]NLR65441.1 response regulator transcription factor [Chitinophaga varians]NML35674.1 response regulator transcription factor [Chitinophaga fulva]QJB33952.1 response regulator transcription factor [Chitinophaga oryzae]